MRGSTRRQSWRRQGEESHVHRAGWVALLLALGVAASLAFDKLVPHSYLIVLVLVCALSGWVGGRLYGVAAAAAAVAASFYFFLEPVGSFRVNPEQLPTAGMLAAVALGIGWMTGQLREARDRLRESENQYRLLLDGVKDHSVFLIDPKGLIATWNTGAQRINGYQASEILGRPSSVFFPPEEVQKGEPQSLLRTAALLGSVRAEGWRLKKDGTRFWADASLTALFEETGKLKGFATTVRDITELRSSKEALEAKEEELRAVVEYAPDAVIMTDGSGTILFLNGRTEVMFGYAAKELLGKKIEVLVPRDRRGGHAAQREGYQENPHARPMGMGLDLYGLRKDGSEFPVEISLGPVESDQHRRFVASVRDMSERRGLEKELQNRKIQEMAQLMVRDLDGRILHWNAGMKRLYGYSHLEAEGAASHELLRTSFPAQREHIEAEVLRTGFWEGELVHHTKDGKRIVVNSCWVLHRDKDGKPSRILESDADVTALKEAEAKARRLNAELEKQNADLTLAKALIESQTQKIAVNAKMSALGEMAGGMAHEINNPMGIIHARASDLMEIAGEIDSVPSAMVVEAMEKIRNTAARVTRITMGLRKFARETRSDPLHEAPVKEIVEDTLSFCTQRLKQQSVELRVAPIDRTLQISCRPTEISQVLLNLLNNSLDALRLREPKWVELTVRERGETVEISITDSGEGIPEAVRDKMGQPFFTTKEVGQGTGLGLSISKGIVESHGGSLRLDTACEHTRFVITLPRAAVRKEIARASR